MIYDDPRFFLSNLYTLQNGNTFLGSYRGLRFRVKPAPEKGDDGEIHGTVAALVWYGEKCLEETEEIVAEAEFELSEEGRQQVMDWLDAQYNQMKKTEGKG